MSEEQRIRKVYSHREDNLNDDRYSSDNPATNLHLRRQEHAVHNLLSDHGMDDLADKTILEVGCGGGAEIHNLIKHGAMADNIYGVDVIPERIDDCRKQNPGTHLYCQSAEVLPFDDESFEIVCQFVMFTSILDPGIRRAIAAEMLRVARKNGLIIWYDYIISKPGNNDARGVGKREIRSLFPGCDIDFRRTSLAPPINRLVAPRSEPIARFLDGIPLLRSHYLAAIRKK